MNAPSESVPVAAELNRLHAEVQRGARESRDALGRALAAAWSAGRLLIEAKRALPETQSGLTWHFWLRRNFRGSIRTAQRYARLAQSVEDVAFLQGMGLRQAYVHLGIATMSGKKSPRLRSRLPQHLVLANRLLRELGKTVPRSAQAPEQVRSDLRRLYSVLQPWYESNAARPR